MLKVSIKNKWKRRDIVFLLERLELYISSGFTIDQALRLCEDGISGRHRPAVISVRKAVEAGGLLSANLSRYIGIPNIFASLIEHGESCGELTRTLSMARLLMERQEELLKRCLSAMTYPVVIGLFSCFLTIGLVRGVMPQIIPMLHGLHVKLPILTRITMWISDILVRHGIKGLIILIILTIGSVLIYRKNIFLRKIIQQLFLSVPVIGRLINKYALSVFLQSCGTLIESGLPVSQSFSNTARSISLLPLRFSLLEEVANMKRGVTLGNVLSHKKIPSYIAPLLSAGEASGSLGSSIIRATVILDRDIEHTLKRLTSLIEPVMMVGMGCVVGAIALSIMMPIYDISRVLQQ
jgi:type IV pilus assembly protein PilC